PPPPQEPLVESDALPQPGDLMTMEMDAYGIERYWPKRAPRNGNPFWKRSAPREPQAARPENISDFSDQPAVSRQRDGSTISDLPPDLSEAIADQEPDAEAMGEGEMKIIEFPATLQPATAEAHLRTSWIDTGSETL